VSAWLAELHNAVGDERSARNYTERALPVARGLNDVRALRRLENLRKHWKVERKSGDSIGLSARETQVLQLLASGSTNAQIARHLSFSVSTIRDDTTSIYRKLEVKGRAEAVGKAIQLGLINKPSV
jgi:DNA-binding CsgD family transcriptional regulator